MTRRPDPENLDELEARLAHDLAMLNYPPANWVPQRSGPDGRPMLDALVVGGGMCGITAAFALRRQGISNIRVIDAGEPGREGPWRTFARMQTLRSPKHLTGPAQSLPALTFRAWYEAQFGLAAWEAQGRIATDMWADYLAWYARVTGAGTENGLRLTHAEPAPDHVACTLRRPDGSEEKIHARKLVLATGRDQLARPRIPPPLRTLVPDPAIRHSSDDIDFAAYRGKRVVVIGIQASAFDNAAAALEAGAGEVILLGRVTHMPRVNKAKQIVYSGFVHGYPTLPDETKLKTLLKVFDARVPAPRESVQRVTKHENARIVMGAEVTRAARTASGLRLETPKGVFDCDLAVLGTGFAPDITAAPELAEIAPHILRWSDRVAFPAAGELLDFPYLDDAFRFLPRPGTNAAGLARVHCFNHAGVVSLGNLANDIPAVSEGADRLARAIAVDLFREDEAEHWRRLDAYDDPELLGDEAPGIDAWSPPLTASSH